MNNDRPLIIGGVAALVLDAGWAGASVLAQRAVEARIRAGIDVHDPEIPVRFANLRHQPGFLHSKGEVDVPMHAQRAGEGVPDTAVGHLRCEIPQGPNPFGAQHVHWQFDVSPKDPSLPTNFTRRFESVEIRGTPDSEPITTARSLKASGRLRVSGNDLMPASIEPLVQQHFVVAGGNGMKSEFDFTDGTLTLDGTPLDLPFVRLMQARIDAAQ